MSNTNNILEMIEEELEAAVPPPISSIPLGKYDIPDLVEVDKRDWNILNNFFLETKSLISQMETSLEMAVSKKKMATAKAIQEILQRFDRILDKDEE